MTSNWRWPTVGLIALALIAPANAGERPDLSSFGDPVDKAKPPPGPQPRKLASRHWPADICAEIQQIESVVTSGPLRPADRGMARGGLLLLEQLHCGIDVSGKFAADQAILGNEEREAQRAYQENMEAAIRAAERAASAPREPIVVQVPQAVPTSSLPDPSPTLNCFTTRLGGGMSSTACR